MFTRLKISENNIEVTFESHELVKLMLDISNQTEKSFTFIPKQGDFHHYMSIRMQGNDLQFLRGDYDVPLFMPMHVARMSDIKQYFFVADELGKWAKNIHLYGWWLIFGERLLFLKNTPPASTNEEKKKRFYIADHGAAVDVLDSTSRIMLNTTWEAETLEYAFLGIWHAEASSPIQANLTRDIMNTMPFDKIHDAYPSRSPKQLVDMLERIYSDEAYAAQHLKRKYTELQYVNKTIKPLLIEHIKRWSIDSVRIDEMLIRRMLAMDIITEVNAGKRDCFFRPLISFDNPESDGADYPKFCEYVCTYLGSHPNDSKILAASLREILKEDYEPSEELYFLPSLAAAWFVGEASRNISAIPTGLMLLDLIEKCYSTSEDTKPSLGFAANIAPLYLWRNIFLHPREPKELSCQDLYGLQINDEKKDGTYPIKYFRGTHPMVHKDSRGDIDTALTNNQKLSRVRQKEGHIILHWLFINFLKKSDRSYKVSLESFNADDPNSYLSSNPNYSQLNQLMAAITNKRKSKAITKDPTLNLKYDLLQDAILPMLKSRCNSLDNLLEPITQVRFAEQQITADHESQTVARAPAPDYEIIGKTDLFSSFLLTCSLEKIELDQEIKTSAILANKVCNYLLNNKDSYKQKVKAALSIIATANFDKINNRLIVGLSEFQSEPEKFYGSCLLRPEDCDPHMLKRKLAEYPALRCAKIELPLPGGVNPALYNALRKFQVILMMQFADALWYKKRLEFLCKTLKTPSISSFLYAKVHNRILELLEQVKNRDKSYEEMLDKEMDILYPLYCKNLITPNASTGQLELEILARMLGVTIYCLTENYAADKQQIFCRVISDNAVLPAYLHNCYGSHSQRKIALIAFSSSIFGVVKKILNTQKELTFADLTPSAGSMITKCLKAQGLWLEKEKIPVEIIEGLKRPLRIPIYVPSDVITQIQASTSQAPIRVEKS